MTTRTQVYGILAGGLAALLSANVQAAAYGVAYNNITNLAVTSTDADGDGGPFFIPVSDFTAFTATSSTSALNNGAEDPANAANAFSGGGPVDAQPAFGLNSIFPFAPPANNAMTLVGFGGNYARADAQVGATAIVQPNIGGPVIPTGTDTQAWNIAEAFVATDGFASAVGSNSSETGFNTQITLDEPAILAFDFEADPFMIVAIGGAAAGGSANANLDVTFSVTSGGTTVFQWSPDGQPGGIANGVELQDGASLNGSIEVTAPGSFVFFDPTGDGSVGTLAPAVTTSYSARTGVLPAGVYTLALDMSENVNLNTAEGASIIIEKTPDAEDEVTWGPGDTASFTIKVTNQGPGTAQNVVIDDDLPTGGALNLSWVIGSEDIANACAINAAQELHCDVGAMAAADMFSVTVETTIPAAAAVGNVVALLGAIGTDFNALDGNLLLDNSAVPAGVGAPALDTKDWETFAGAITCIPSDGCALDTPSGSSDNSYTQGAKEDTRNPATADGSIPPSKDDLLRWYHTQEFLSGNAYLYLAWIRSNQLATATIDFELNQSGLLEANGVNPQRTEGDVLIVYDFRGGRVDRLDMLRWLEPGSGHVDDDCEANSGSVAAGCWGNIVDLLGSGLAEGSVNFDDNGTNKPGDDGYPISDPIQGGTILKARFGEAAIDLTGALGPADECLIFAQAFVKSRASSSFTSELKDFIGPVPTSISNCIPVDNTAIGNGSNVPQVSDDGTFLLKP